MLEALATAALAVAAVYAITALIDRMRHDTKPVERQS